MLRVPLVYHILVKFFTWSYRYSSPYKRVRLSVDEVANIAVMDGSWVVVKRARYKAY